MTKLIKERQGCRASNGGGVREIEKGVGGEAGKRKVIKKPSSAREIL